MADFGVGAENNRRKSKHYSRIMGLRVCVKHGCCCDCDRAVTAAGDEGFLWPSWPEIPLAM